MQILYLTDKNIIKEFDLWYLSSFAELEDVIIANSYEEAISVIISVVKEQTHLDLIVVDFEFLDEKLKHDLVIWVRDSSLCYSLNNFRLASIPIIHFKDDSDFFRREYYLPREFSSPLFKLYDRIIYDKLPNQAKTELIGNTLSSWMQKIGDDLDCLDLDLDLKFKPSRTEVLIKSRGYKLTVLTEHFIRNRQKLPYLWFGKNLQDLNISMSGFHDLLKKSERQPSLRNEKEIHHYFNNNLRIILGEYYSATHYEKHYSLNSSRKYVEPDYTNIPNRYYKKRPEIFEVKLPSQRIFKKDGTLYDGTQRAINQISNKYKGYFQDSRNTSEIFNKIGVSDSNFNFTLLIGRTRDRDECLDHIQEVCNSKGFKLRTYDDLLVLYQTLYNRTMKYNLT